MIPRGDWIVVMRRVRDTQSRGQVQRSGLREKDARAIAADIRAREDLMREWSCWAMQQKDY